MSKIGWKSSVLFLRTLWTHQGVCQCAGSIYSAQYGMWKWAVQFHFFSIHYPKELYTVFVHLHVHCACARMYRNWEYCHLASLGWNDTLQTFCSEPTNYPLLGYLKHMIALLWIMMTLWVQLNMISTCFWANTSTILLDLPWKMLRIAVQILYDRSKRLVLCVLLVFLLWMLLSPIIAQRQSISLYDVWRHPSNIEGGVRMN